MAGVNLGDVKPVGEGVWLLEQLANAEEIEMTAKAGRSHDEVVVEMLRTDPEFADA